MLKNLPDNFGAFVISVIVVGAFTAVTVYTMVHGVQDNPTLQNLVGALITAFSMVVGYWIGSSSGSKSKDATIATLKANGSLPPPVAALLAILLAVGLLMGSGGHAWAAQKAKARSCIPYPQCLGGGGGQTPPDLKQFPVQDMKDAEIDALARKAVGNEQDYADCWHALIVEATTNGSPLPDKPGLAITIQKWLDFQASGGVKNIIPKDVAKNCIVMANDLGVSLVQLLGMAGVAIVNPVHLPIP